LQEVRTGRSQGRPVPSNGKSQAVAFIFPPDAESTRLLPYRT
jgi:hypothetical protein